MKEKEERKSLTKSNSQNPRTNSQNRKTLETQIKTPKLFTSEKRPRNWQPWLAVTCDTESQMKEERR